MIVDFGSRQAPDAAVPDLHQLAISIKFSQSNFGRKFDAVVVWNFDRFARSVSHLLHALETYNALGSDFVSLSEQIDTSTPTGKMVFTVLGAVAELERSLIAERVRAGIRNARTKGKRIGRPRVTVDAARIAALRGRGSRGARSAASRASERLSGLSPVSLCLQAADSDLDRCPRLEASRLQHRAESKPPARSGKTCTALLHSKPR
jgi:DNA invertase Pin-like site-specific DNA recombinase